MPGGLAGVEQSFTAETSGYLAGIRQMIGANQDLVSSVRDTMSQVADAQSALRGAGGGAAIGGNADDITRTNSAIRETLASLREVAPAMQAAQQAGADYATVVDYLGTSHANTTAMIRQAITVLDQMTGTLGSAAQAHGAATDATADHAVAAINLADAQLRANDAAKALIVNHLQQTHVLRDGEATVRAYESSVGSLGNTARDTSSALADVAAAAAAASAGGGGGGGGGPALGATLRSAGGSLDQIATDAGFASYRDLMAASGLRPSGGGGGGGGGDLASLIAAASGGGGGASGGGGGDGGGGGGGRGDTYGAFTPWRGGGAAAVRFWGMAAAEVASTVVPALVAAGSSALVGLQGGQQLYNRYSAIDSVSGALGGAYGQTTGSFLGIGSNLQNAQNAAAGGVYELAGAGINLLKSGTGNGLLQQGTNTIAMLDRAAANMVINAQQNGLGQKLAGALGGGTGYLQQFGDVAANLGTSALDFAPNLPGVGSDLLSTLTGASGLVRSASGLPPALLKSFFSYEASSRWGPALLGGEGLIGRALGLRGVGGLGGLLGKGGEALASRGLGGALGDVGLGMIGAGDTLAALTGPEIGVPLAAYQLESSLLDKYTATGGAASAARTIAGLQGGVADAGFSGAWQPLAKAVTETTGLAAAADATPYAAPGRAAAGKEGLALQYAYSQSPGQQYARAAEGFSQSMGDLVAAGPQLVTALHKAGLKSVSMADAFQIAQNALLDIPHAFGPGGKLTKTAQTMLSDYVNVIGPMTQTAGGFGAAVGGQAIMSSATMKNLSAVNQSMDSMTQIMSGTPLGASGLAATYGGVTSPAALAKALTSVTSAGSGAAWNTFASTSASTPGIVTQLQQFNDQMRTGLTLGAIGPGQAAGMTAYELKQALPMAKNSPAALAMLMQQGAQEGITGYYQGGAGDLAKNYAAAEKSVGKMADSTKQMNADSTAMTIKLANIPDVAKQFTQGTGAAIQSQQEAKAAQDAVNIKGGLNISANAADLVSQLKAAGVQGGAALRSSLDAVLQQAGVSKAVRLKVEADATPAAAAINALHGKNVKVGATADSSEVTRLERAIAAVHGKTVNLTAVAPLGAVSALGQAIASVHGKTVTINVDQVYSVTTSGSAPGGGVVTVGGKASPYTPAGAAANLLPAAFFHPKAQAGMRIPGYGGGDIFPAMLEPGEAVVPKHLVGQLAPFLGAHGVPGFAAGMIPAGMNLGQFQAMTSDASQSHLPIPAAASKVLDSLLAELAKSGAWKQAGVNVINGITYSLSNPADAAKVGAALVKTSSADATALANNFQTSMNYARTTAGTAASGLNLAGMDTTPGGGGGTIQEQMQSYLGSVQGFTGDLKTLSKDGLNKGIIQQLVAAGPVQGDALSQSILNSYGGVGMTNSLYAQIGKASNALGALAGMAVYGGKIAPDLKSGTSTSSNVTINVSAPGGAGSDLNLTSAQIKTLTEMIQAKLLQQAKRNPKTGLTLAGKNS